MINNKVLLCGTENYLQYSMINHNGKEYKKKNEYIYIYICIYIYIYIYIKLNCFAIQQKLTQHCKSTVLQLKKYSLKKIQEIFCINSCTEAAFTKTINYFFDNKCKRLFLSVIFQLRYGLHK